jgi:hypothetical protein
MEATSVKIHLCSHMLETCRYNARLSKKVMNTKIFFRTALQLGISAILTAIVLLLQTPVPNYQDVDLSFMYGIKFPKMDPVKLEQNSPYDFLEQHISFMFKVAELQLSSPRIREFMRFVKFVLLLHRLENIIFTYLLRHIHVFCS